MDLSASEDTAAQASTRGNRSTASLGQGVIL
jgi:hypothetical protein